MEDLYSFFARPKDPLSYTAVRISLASSEKIREWSYGEIKKPETINYRTFKPERDGLFCAKIFGPTKDYECNCGKYKRMKHRGVVCEKCGVEVIQSKVRRERMGHISLATPVAHIWFLRSLPGKIGNLLDLTLKELEKVLYFDAYIVIDPKETGLAPRQLLPEDAYREALEKYGHTFEVGIGAEAIKVFLERLDLDEEYKRLRAEILSTGSETKRKKLSKQLKIVEAFRNSGNRPEWMIMDVIPVLPPDVRPLVPLEGGRFATSDLNDLYRRVINRNNRLKRLQDLRAPDIIIRNEKRMLQEAVDVLFDNGRYGRVVTGPNRRPLKSLSDALRGKQGRFRQNLLGKRVDYSGRTVIVIGPELRLHQCGLPKKMALELFKPFVFYRLEEKGLVTTVKGAKKLVERETPEVWDTLDEVVKEYPVILNRAPTLHRLGMQAFEPILIEGKAIQLHPLVCTAFNADFDGDQMAVHVPLSIESQIEARVLMLSSNNILSPSNGDPIIVPTQDIVLGIYYMTRAVLGSRGEGKVFANPEEVRSAYDADEVDLHARIVVRIDGQRVETTVGRVILREILPHEPVVQLRHIIVSSEKEARGALADLREGEDFVQMVQRISESGDRAQDGDMGFVQREQLEEVYAINPSDTEAIFALDVGELSDVIKANGSYHIFKGMGKRVGLPFELINKVMDKKAVSQLINYCYRTIGGKATVILADRLKDIGYRYATRGGISICVDDMVIPHDKWDIIKKAEQLVVKINEQYTEGLITRGEKYNKVVDIWAKATTDVANEMMEEMKIVPLVDKEGQPVFDEEGQPIKEESFNAVYMMADSGSRGSKDQMRQLAGMRGLMAKPSGEIIETPITANFREGLTVLQYFSSTHGARKGLADTALKTANSGYLTRRLVDVAQDCVTTEEDCGALTGIEVEPLVEGGEIIKKIGERVLGRVALEDIRDPYTDEVLVRANEEIDEEKVARIDNAGLTRVKIRSVLTCKSADGACCKCYGRDLAYGQPVEIGTPIGILAAQSIGEPGTQLTMRTFHIGGTARGAAEEADFRAISAGRVKYVGINTVENARGEFVVMNRQGGEFAIVDDQGRERERYPVIYGAHFVARDGLEVKAGDLLVTWDPYTTPILTEVGGVLKYGDILPGTTMQEKVDPVTGKASQVIVQTKDADVRPRISIKDEKGKTAKLPSGGDARYFLPLGAILMVSEGDTVNAGDVIAKLPRETTKTKDITGGLPRVAELFECRKPKEAAILTEIDGYVSVSKGAKGRQKITITPPDVGEKKEYLVPRGKHISVLEGDYLKAGDALMGGSANPHDILNIQGDLRLARYLVDEVQEVYRLQGVRINDKHIEVIVRQMLRRVKIVDPGDTEFILEEHVDKMRFEEINREVVARGGKPAVANPLLLGITKASLSTESFISAASFQETTKVLTEASIAGKVDHLKGLKENVIMGRIIPAGTGMTQYRGASVVLESEEMVEESEGVDDLEVGQADDVARA
ncbi:MAG: DNA-directed RNA polymerase subunit beta' [Deltaproteobacteria bacterium]|nr:DNA-directed RNA polymerase subunit beta' [Deltaproteobacteria bacterium]MBW1794968.1 DNA-directed RNA polymerase subunit beta' [Deltaproteobacteria bacterium]MBW2330102.1 DNA-directed RNA polymerase subunit beta' [Deltaproteobacteria bacterium]